MRTGIYGGSFDPVHKGHIHLAETALKGFDLDRVIFMPANISPFKQGKKDVAEGRHRLEMIKLAIAERENMTVSSFELECTEVSYTVNTLRRLRKQYPNDTLVLLMGSDMFMSFERWYCYEEIMSLAELGCISREDGDGEILKKQAVKLLEKGTVRVISGDTRPMSSGEIKTYLKKNEDCSCYLPEKVVQYIMDHNLYGREQRKEEV